MSSINEKFHFLFLILSSHTLLFITYKSSHHQHKENKINNLCPGACIPWRLNNNLQRSNLAILAIHKCPYLNLITTSLHLTERKRVHTFLRFMPHTILFEAILVSNILRMLIVKHRQFHCKRSATSRDPELTLTEIHCHIINKESRERNNKFLIILPSQVARIKYHSSPITAKH